MKPKDLFFFNRSDRGVLLFFLLLLVGGLALMGWLGGGGGRGAAGSVDSTAATDRPQPRFADTDEAHPSKAYEPYAVAPAHVPERFPFDPNTADSSQLLRLGLQPWQVRNIYRYRAAGGIYRRPADFARLYGLTRRQYRELEPYIRISDDYLPAATRYATATPVTADTIRRHPAKLGPTERVDLNAADTTLLMRVPGIGPYFAARIVNYRQRLGGYAHTEQLREIDDFPEQALGYFVTGGGVQRLKVNRLRLGELRRHPYINYYQAKAIVDYRRLHGPLTSLDQLRLLDDFTAADIDRLRPYVEF